MYTGEQPGAAVPRSPDVDARPVILVLVEDTIGSLASLLLAAEIADSRQARLHVAHVSAPRVWWGAAAGMPVPTAMLAEADRAAAGELRDRVGSVLALGPPVEWTFTWSRGVVHDAVTRLVSEISPIAVVVGERRRPWLSLHRSMARWLIGRPNVQAVVVPA
jgi:Universal stress protein family